MIVFIECACIKTAKRRAAWAAKIAVVEGGFIAFEYVSDYVAWKNQK
jgi:hypothetical protein